MPIWRAPAIDQGHGLVPFYVAYRAAVRAKVNGIKARSARGLRSTSGPRPELDARAQWILALGSLEERPRRPCLVLVGGLPGTGKSTLARELASMRASRWSAPTRFAKSWPMRAAWPALKPATASHPESTRPSGMSARTRSALPARMPLSSRASVSSSTRASATNSHRRAIPRSGGTMERAGDRC